MMHAPRTIVIGGSAGSLEALAAILPSLPSTFAFPIALVVHMPPTSESQLVDVLRNKTALAVREVDDKEPLTAATLHVAPPNYHLLIEADARLSLSIDAPLHYSRPSIDVLFESAADSLGSAVVGVLLSGANEDGAQGLWRIQQAGGTTVVQSPETSAVATMPAAALHRMRADYVLPQHEIGEFLAGLDNLQQQRGAHG